MCGPTSTRGRPCFRLYLLLRPLSFVRDWKELRRLARSGRSAPMHHVAVISAVRMQGQLMIRKEPPAFGVGRHSRIIIGLALRRLCVTIMMVAFSRSRIATSRLMGVG